MKKKISLIIAITFCIHFFLAQETQKQNVNSEPNKEDTIKVNDYSKLTAKEKYAIKMLKSGYRMESIVLKTKLTKKRLRELKKEYL